MKSPGATKAGSSTLVTPPASGGAGTGGSEGKGHRRSRSKGGRKDSETAAEAETRLQKNPGTVGREEKESGSEHGQEKSRNNSVSEANRSTTASNLPLTPTRRKPSTSALTPQAIAMTVGSVSMETNPMDTSDPFAADTPFLGANDMPMDLEKEVAVDGCGLSVPLEPQNLEMVSQASALTSNTLNSGLDEPLLHQKSPVSTIASRVVPLTSVPLSPPDILIKQEPDNQEVSIKRETSESVPFVKKEPAVEQERPAPAPAQREEPLTDAVADFCRDALGRGVIGLGDLKDKLLLKQISVGAGHPLQQGVSDAVLEGALGLLGAVEVGQPLGKRLFALPHNDVVTKNLQVFHYCMHKQMLI